MTARQGPSDTRHKSNYPSLLCALWHTRYRDVCLREPASAQTTGYIDQLLLFGGVKMADTDWPEAGPSRLLILNTVHRITTEWVICTPSPPEEGHISEIESK